MNSNLLKEAIADAKAVRQTALANAKAALDEAFGSRIEAMLSPKLEEETNDETGNDVITDPNLPAPPTDQPQMPEEGVVNETDIEEIIRELEQELPQTPSAPTPGAPGEVPPTPGVPGALDAGVPPAPMPPTPGVPGAPDAGVPPAPMPPTPGVPPAPMPPTPDVPEEQSEEMDEEININELLESLKAEADEEEGCENDDECCLQEGVPVKSSGIGDSDNKMPSSDADSTSHIETAGKDRVGGGEGYKSGPSDATTAKRPNQGKNVTKTNLSTPGGALKENTGGSTPGYPEGAKKTSTGKDPSEANRPNQAEHAKKDKLDTVPSPLKEENAQLKTQLAEAEQTLNYLRTQLNEINLLNAKLLYTNRLFKEYSMDNGKKMKIVEMFDLAKNVREVKMTYAVIAESLNFGADFKGKAFSKVQSITEGMADRMVSGTASSKQIITESAKSEMVTKFQKLAGIKPSLQQPIKK